MISFEEFNALYDSIQGEPEFEIIFDNTDKTYMIIKYDDHVSFQRCGIHDGSGEIEYPNLMNLYYAKSVDDICLNKEWGKIKTIIADDSFDLSLPSDLYEYKQWHKLINPSLSGSR